MFLNEGAKLQNGRYLILRELGSGGMGTAYLARDTVLEREVVVKTSRDDLEPEQLRFEAKMPARLRHPNLPVIFDYIRAQAGQAYIVMEYIRGETLDDIVKPHGRCEVEQVLTWIPKLLSALQHLHTQNPPLIHRDVKPANICLTPNSELFLLDFGIARHLDGSDTRVEAQARSDGYAPIEQYAGDSRLNHRPSVKQYIDELRQAGYATAPYTDIYSFGATLYFLLTAKNPPTAVLRVLGEPLEAISDLNESVPELLAEAITKALALHPRDRFQSADDMQQFLAPILAIQAPPKSAASAHRPVPFMSDDLPFGFVPRPAEFEAILSAVLTDADSMVTLQGAGGFGKTTLAQAICHDQRVWTAFPDGILWVTLGETPDITGGLTKLYAILTGQRPAFIDQEDGANHLALALKDKQCLLVIDDVWNPAHLRPFLRGGPGCVRLITTRLRDMLLADSAQITIDTMQQAEAVSLLAVGLPDGEADALKQLVARLGAWPLLVKLANGVLQHRVNKQGQLVVEALAYMNRGLDKYGPTAFDRRNPLSRDQAVTETLQVSFGLLTADEYARFSELAIFPDDVDIPLSTVETLWSATGGLDELDTEELLDHLSRLSLLQRFSLNSRFVRLHDVIRHFLRKQHKQQLPEIHRLFLDAHRPRRPSFLLPEPSQAAKQTDAAFSWADLAPDEPYLWRHLAHHLIEAGAEKEFAATVKDLRYLALKCYLSDVVMAEFDLQRAEKLMPGDTVLNRLRQTFIQNSHLLQLCSTLHDLLFTLISRFRETPDLKTLIDSLNQTFNIPHFEPAAKLPDLPSLSLYRTLFCFEKVTNIGFSADNRLIFGWNSSPIFTPAETFYFAIWEIETGKKLKDFFGNGRVQDINSRDQLILISQKGTLKVIHLYGGQEIFALNLHPDDVTGMFTPDGRELVSVAEGRPIKFWDLNTGAEVRAFRGYTGTIKSWDVSSNGRFLACFSNNSTLHIWDIESGNLLRTLAESQKSWAKCWVLENSPRVMLCGCSQEGDKKIYELKIWDIETGYELFTIQKEKDFCHQFSLGDRLIVIEFSTESLHIHDAEDGKLINIRHQIPGHYCGLSPDTNNLIFHDHRGNTLKFWDIAKWQEVGVLKGHTEYVTQIVFSPDGTLLASTDEKTIKLWHHKTISGYHTNPILEQATKCCALSPNGKILVFPLQNELIIWDANEHRLITTIYVEAVINHCAFSPDGRFLLTALHYDTVKLWHVESWLQYRSFVQKQPVSEDDLVMYAWDMSSGTFSPDGEFIAFASMISVKVLNKKTGKEVLNLPGPTGTGQVCKFSPNGKKIASANGSSLNIWNIDSGGTPLSLVGHFGEILNCDFSPDGKFVVTASSDDSLKIWNLRDGRELGTLVGHLSVQSLYEGVNACAFSPNGRLILSVSTDNTLKIWDVGGIRDGQPGHCVATFPVNGALYDCAWHPDGERIIAVGDGGVYFLRFVT